MDAESTGNSDTNGELEIFRRTLHSRWLSVVLAAKVVEAPGPEDTTRDGNRGIKKLHDDLGQDEGHNKPVTSFPDR
jgi:hypothetical protein